MASAEGDHGHVVAWAPGFISYAGRSRIAESALVRSGHAMGMDASSAFAIWALDLQPRTRTKLHWCGVCEDVTLFRSPSAGFMLLSWRQTADD